MQKFMDDLPYPPFDDGELAIIGPSGRIFWWVNGLDLAPTYTYDIDIINVDVDVYWQEWPKEKAFETAISKAS